MMTTTRDRRRPRRTAAATGLLLLLVGSMSAGTAVAQEQEEESSGRLQQESRDQEARELGPKKDEESLRPFFYLFPTAGQLGVDTTRVGDESVSDTVSALVPFVASLRAASRRVHFYTIYEPQMERFVDRPELDTWNHSGAMALDVRLSPRTSFGLGGSLLSTKDPTRAIAELPLVLDRGDFLSTRGYLSLGHRFSRKTFVDVAVDTGLLRYDALEGKPDVGIDSVGHGAIVGLSRRLNQAHTLDFRYAYVYERALESADELPEELAVLLPLGPQHGFDVGWQWEMDRNLTLSVSAGIAYADRVSWLGSVIVEKEWEHLRLLADYQRLLGSFENLAPRRRGPGGTPDIADPLLPREISRIGTAADIFGASIEGRTENVQIAGRAQMSLGSYGDVGPYLDGLTLGAGVKVRLHDRIQPYVQVDYITQGLTPELGVRRTRSRYAAGLVLVIGPSPDDAPLALELERRRTRLPYAGAKRPW